jgi:hypothetical protein
LKKYLQTSNSGANRREVRSRRAIVVLPPAASLPELANGTNPWLTRGTVCRLDGHLEPLTCVLQELGATGPAAGFAALRYWGQTGQRPDGWVTAADPVNLEAMLDHLVLHTLEGDALSPEEQSQLFEVLQQYFGEHPGRFELLGHYGYLHGGPRFAGAARSPQVLENCEPDRFLPTGSDAREHDRLIGELQMLLHATTLNRGRATRGLVPVNSIWFWGGGEVPRLQALDLPALVADDALFKGYWQCAGGNASNWPGDPGRWLKSLLARGPGNFVAVMPDGAEQSSRAAVLLQGLKWLLLRGAIRQLSLICRDGWLLRLDRLQLFAFWRSRSWPDRPGTVQ